MELDWCSEEDFKNTSNFNENSIISNEKRKNTQMEENIQIKTDVNVKNCLNLNLEINSKKDLLNIMNYLSSVSDFLRKFVRNKSSKFSNPIEISNDDYLLIKNYLGWLNLASNIVKNIFAVPLRRDNSYDPNTIKLFKTSSYKFCNFKESCSIHKNKQSKCDKNHFVFDMIINDISKLIESVEIVGLENINLILSNQVVKVTYIPDTKKYQIEKVTAYINTYELTDTEFIIDKTLIFKSFDVISYVLNKMYEESFYFLSQDSPSFLINF